MLRVDMEGGNSHFSSLKVLGIQDDFYIETLDVLNWDENILITEHLCNTWEYLFKWFYRIHTNLDA